MNKYVSVRLFVDKDDKISFRTYEDNGKLYHINDVNQIEMMLNGDNTLHFETTVKKISVDNNWREVGSRVVDISHLFLSKNENCKLIKISH